MRTPNENLSAPAPGTQAAALPGRRMRVVVSVLVGLHLFAVFVGPWALPPQNSELSASAARVLRPYLEILSLANGYRFFAPEPGPSHLVRYEATLDDGTLKTGTFPDSREHVPRLLYHRYFMLSEFANTLTNPNLPGDRAEALARGYAEHLSEAHHAKTVRLFLRRHFVPRPEEVRRGMQLSDKALYQEQPLGVFTRETP
ncbi:MAG TPA: hypothetical protein VGJ16_03280 [Pirellulales bacterium]